ncbi:MAG: B12-binding domain-containing radical SAM protein [Planctomycetes bacterium]|nr:B12-binding domain-containing radical SAM protein [Planctomycetota bacterium]
MKVQLIHPPVYLNVHAMTALRPSVPLGLAYVAASLREAGHAVSILDAVGEAPDQVSPGLRPQLFQLGLTPDQIVDRIDPGADALGITNMWSFSWPLVREIVRRVKARFPDKPLVAGGEHFTGLPEMSMEQSPVDVVVLGEGEEGAVEVFAALARQRAGESVDWAAIPGICYRGPDGRPVRSLQVRARRKDVDAIPWPAWDLIKVDVYNEYDFVNGIKKGKTVPILATRGCPYQCTYCSSPNMWTTRWYPRDPKDVVDEIEHYHRTLGATNFPFQDLTAIVKKEWIVAFCNELLARRLDIQWQFPSGTRCEVVDDEVASLLYRTGGRSLAFAPESGSERTRKLIRKQMKTDSLLDAVRSSVRHRLNVTAFIVIGFPHDEASDLKETARLARQLARLGIDDIAVGFFFPIPNTHLYRELMARGRLSLNDDSLLTPIFANEEKLLAENNYCDHLSHRQLTRWKYRILWNFYATSFALRPWRVAQILWNALRGRETRKLETFLVDLRRKAGIAIRERFGRRKPAKQPATA